MGKVIMNISFLSDQDMQELLKEAGFKQVTRFFHFWSFLQAG
ncbi:hypothetical protein OL548_18635 [Lysinibacillus sp. MHQ-1]|nr:hypothetical protein OL548_18635 [Lysinibacillus sp. MHQ-1]